MGKYMKRMIITAAGLICFALISNTLIQPGDNPKLEEILSKLLNYNQKYPQQKIYLHFDRNKYNAGDNIWFKAYITDRNNIPDTLSNNLYVELINPDNKVSQVKVVKIDKGFA